LFGGVNDTQRSFKRLDAMAAKFISAKRNNEYSFESLKDEMRLLESRARQKKRELDQARGHSKRIVVGEIERVFREMDRLRGRENIIAANLDRIGVALAKVGEAKAALRADVSEEQFDDIALEIEDLFDTLKALDVAATDLAGEKYEAPVASEEDVDQRVANVQAAEKAPVVLSPETEKRLEQLEAE
jgi:hypothetical protein